MKIRAGFVSNSSSCSFSIMKSALSMEQYDHLRNHIAFAKLKKWDDDWAHYDDGDSWDIVTTSSVVKCNTFMTNFDLHKFVLEVLLVQEDAIIDYWHS